MSIIKNAVIESADIDTDRGLGAWLHLDYGACGQGFGGFVLYVPAGWKHHGKEKNIAGHFIYRVLEIAGVEKWSQLRGKTIRVRKESEFGLVEAIGHIIKDDWFDPRADFQKMGSEGSDERAMEGQRPD